MKYYLCSIHSLFVWRECLAHQVPIVLTVLSFRFSGLCLMVVNATIESPSITDWCLVFSSIASQIESNRQASPVGVWSFLRLPLNPSRGKKKCSIVLKIAGKRYGEVRKFKKVRKFEKKKKKKKKFASLKKFEVQVQLKSLFATQEKEKKRVAVGTDR